MKQIKIAFVVLIVLALTACPAKKSNQDETVTTSFAELESELAKTSTGTDSLKYLNDLRQSGYQIDISFLNTTELSQRPGQHNGGGIHSERAKQYTILINNEVSLNEKVHVLAHELVHIKDDLTIEAFLKRNPVMENKSKDFILNYQTGSNQSTGNYDSKVVGYVLNTLFCTEARAYTKNTLLNNQGYKTQIIATTELGNYINQNYIIRNYNLSYGDNPEAMYNWCMKFNSMEQIQEQLKW